MNLRVAVLPGDGVGPEVVPVALRVLSAVARHFGHEVTTSEHPVGWHAVRHHGDPLPPQTVDACRTADAVLLGAVGHPEADDAPPAQRPETGLLRLRKSLGCFANLRPANVSDHLVAISPLRAAIVRGTDLVFVRELAGGIYYGEATETAGIDRASNTMAYTADEIRRVARTAFELARSRRGTVTSIDKANVLGVSRLWRRVVDGVATSYPDVTHHHMLVDRAAMELVFHPRSFDVLLTGNLFGDILTDQAAALVGSIGLLGSASIGGRTDVYEPVHGSAPDIAGQDVVNPVGAIVSIAMMLRYTFGLQEAAQAVEDAVESVWAAGIRTADLAGENTTKVGTHAFGELVAEACAGAPLVSPL